MSDNISEKTDYSQQPDHTMKNNLLESGFRLIKSHHNSIDTRSIG